MRTFRTYSLINIQIYHTAVLTMVMMLYITSLVLIYLITVSWYLLTTSLEFQIQPRSKEHPHPPFPAGTPLTVPRLQLQVNKSHLSTVNKLPLIEQESGETAQSATRYAFCVSSCFGSVMCPQSKSPEPLTLVLKMLG